MSRFNPGTLHLRVDLSTICVPLEDAKIGVMTLQLRHRCIRGHPLQPNEEEGQVYVFRMKEHFYRLRKSNCSQNQSVCAVHAPPWRPSHE